MKDTMILYLMLWRNKMREYIKRQKGQTVNGPAPARLKRSIVARCGQQFHCNVLIETGTYLGEMIEYQAKYFEKIYSIEISELFYNFSSKRLRKRKNIIVMQGDSSTVLEKVIRKLTVTDKVLFWLDGHYSGGKTGMGGVVCPIYKELTCVFNMRNGQDVILIDDARLFNGTEGYPSLEELKNFIREKNDRVQIIVKDDMIRIK